MALIIRDRFSREIERSTISISYSLEEIYRRNRSPSYCSRDFIHFCWVRLRTIPEVRGQASKPTMTIIQSFFAIPLYLQCSCIWRVGDLDSIHEV